MERVDGLVQVHTEGFLGIQAPSDADQALREDGVNTPSAPQLKLSDVFNVGTLPYLHSKTPEHLAMPGRG